MKLNQVKFNTIKYKGVVTRNTCLQRMTIIGQACDHALVLDV